ncbi:MAG: HAD family hydrolase [Promethearchaeota archaeon]
MITFDYWNTLFLDKHLADLRIRYLDALLNKQNAPRSHEEIREAYLATQDYVRQVWEKESYRYVSLETRFNYILKILNVKLPREIKQNAINIFKKCIFEDPPSLIEGVYDVLETLSENYSLGIISDTGITPGQFLRKILKRNNILHFFSSTIFSDEMGFNKPHEIMFKTALSELNGTPSEAIHIGDLLQTDVFGAKSAGMKVIWLNWTGKKPKDYLPDFEINDLSKVVNIIESIT